MYIRNTESCEGMCIEKVLWKECIAGEEEALFRNTFRNRKRRGSDHLAPPRRALRSGGEPQGATPFLSLAFRKSSQRAVQSSEFFLVIKHSVNFVSFS